jgi:hypothetical protein
MERIYNHLLKYTSCFSKEQQLSSSRITPKSPNRIVEALHVMLHKPGVQLGPPPTWFHRSVAHRVALVTAKWLIAMWSKLELYKFFKGTCSCEHSSPQADSSKELGRLEDDLHQSIIRHGHGDKVMLSRVFLRWKRQVLVKHTEGHVHAHKDGVKQQYNRKRSNLK